MLTLFATALITAAPATDTLLVSPEWLAARLSDPRVVVLAVGSAEYRRGHIPGARLIDLMDVHGHDGTVPVGPVVRAMERAGVSNDSRVVIYGLGVDMNPGILFTALDLIGLGDRTSILDGGLPAWVRAGQRVTQEIPKPVPGRLTPRANPDVMVEAPAVRAALGRQNTLFLDARTRGEYLGNDTRDLRRGGHLPGAIHLYWEETFDQKTGRFLPREVLAARFQAAGARPDSEIITYCLIGMRASHLYFVARLLGYQARVYVGSMADWSALPSATHPLVTGPAPGAR